MNKLQIGSQRTPLKIKKPTPEGRHFFLVICRFLRWYYPGQVQRVGDCPVTLSARYIPTPRDKLMCFTQLESPDACPVRSSTSIGGEPFR